jgi:hypothetical protein
MKAKDMDRELLEERYEEMQWALFHISEALDPDAWFEKKMRKKRAIMIDAIHEILEDTECLLDVINEYEEPEIALSMSEFEFKGSWMEALGLTNDEDEQSEKK